MQPEKKTTKANASTASAAERQLKSFIAKFSSEHQTLIRTVRRALQKRFPIAYELVYDNYNFFVIGYGPTERPSEAILSIVGGVNGVGLCFLHGAKLPDPKKILIGSGKQTRFIRLPSADVLARPEVEALLKAAVARSKVPFRTSGRSDLIIRSISKKQRPRRKTAQQ